MADYLLFVGPPFPDEDYAEGRESAESCGRIRSEKISWEWDGENPKMQLSYWEKIH